MGGDGDGDGDSKESREKGGDIGEGEGWKDRVGVVLFCNEWGRKGMRWI